MLAEDVSSAPASSSARRRSVCTMARWKQVRSKHEKVVSKLGMLRPESKEAKKPREATGEARRQDPKRHTTAEHRAFHRESKARARAARKKSDLVRVVILR